MDETGPKSKKPSGANSSSTPKPPEIPVLFLDEGLARYVIAGALRAAGARVEIHADHFTKDYGIRYRGLALHAIRRAGTRVFVLKRSADLRADEMAAIFVKALPAIPMHRQGGVRRQRGSVVAGSP